MEGYDFVASGEWKSSMNNKHCRATAVGLLVFLL